MADHLSGKVVVMTGAGSGFGKLPAVNLGAAGAKVICLDINGASAYQTADAIRQ